MSPQASVNEMLVKKYKSRRSESPGRQSRRDTMMRAYIGRAVESGIWLLTHGGTASHIATDCSAATVTIPVRI